MPLLIPISPSNFPPVATLVQQGDLVHIVDSQLDLTSSQRTQVDPILVEHRRQIEEIKNNPSLSASQRRAQIVESLRALKSEMLPYLSAEQARRVDRVLGIGIGASPRHSLLPDVGVSYSILFPTGGESRAIFGNSVGSFGLAIGDASGEVGSRLRYGFSLNTLGLSGHGNDLFVLSPVATVQYRAPLVDRIYAYAIGKAGPSYLDYSLDTPDGRHLGAKRLGAVFAAEVGLRYGQLSLGVEYRTYTQPAGIDFSSVELSLTWTAIRF